MIGPLAHGGVVGAIVETAILIGIVAVFAAVWLRSRNSGLDEDAERPPVDRDDEARA